MSIWTSKVSHTWLWIRVSINQVQKNVYSFTKIQQKLKPIICFTFLTNRLIIRWIPAANFKSNDYNLIYFQVKYSSRLYLNLHDTCIFCCTVIKFEDTLTIFAKLFSTDLRNFSRKISTFRSYNLNFSKELR